jgi:hypothetical protein
VVSDVFGERGIQIVASCLDNETLLPPSLETLLHLCYCDENRSVIRSQFGIADLLLVLKNSPSVAVQELALRVSDLLL